MPSDSVLVLLSCAHYCCLARSAGYLRTLTHSFAVCDRCMSHISGEWFHCAYCPKDLCDSCAEVDTHDNTHLFVVFKSEVNMQIFRCVSGFPPLSWRVIVLANECVR